MSSSDVPHPPGDRVTIGVFARSSGLTPSALRLYADSGLRATRAALRPRGVLAVWSASKDAAFSKRLAHAGFAVSEHVVRPHRAGKGPRHVIWIAA